MAAIRGHEWGTGGFTRGAQEQVRHNHDFSSTPGAMGGASPSTSDAESGMWSQQPSGSPWLRWLRPRGVGSNGRRSSGRSTPNAVATRPPASAEEVIVRHQFDALEDRLLSMFAGMHQQVVADRQEGDRLVERSANRLEAQIGMTEQQQQRLDRRVSDLAVFVQSLDEEQQAHVRRVSHVSDIVQNLQASRGQSEQELQRRLADLEQDQRALVGATHAAAARDEEAQRRYINRLRPIEERLCVLENEQREACSSPSVPRSGEWLPTTSSPPAGSAASLSALRDFETSVAEETRAIHARCDHMQEVVDSNAIKPVQHLGRQLEKLSFADSERSRQVQAQEANVASMSATLDAHERQLREVRERLERLVLIESNETEPSVSSSQQRRLPASSTPPRARTEDLPAEVSERFDDLERRVRQNASATTKLQDNLRAIHRSLGDIKGSIDMAICERRAQSEESFGMDGGHSAIFNDHHNSSLRSSEVGDHISRLSETLQMHKGQLQELPHLANRLIGVESGVKKLGEAMGTLSGDMFKMAEENSSRREAETAEARDNLQRFERFERLVSDIQSQVMELGRQLEESLSLPMRSQYFNANGLDPEGDDATRSVNDFSPKNSCGNSPSSSLLQADTLLRMVEQVVGRQQRELARLTANLNLQCAEVAKASGIEGDLSELMPEALVKPLELEEEPSTSPSAPATGKGEVGDTDESEGKDVEVESSEKLSKVQGRGFLSGSSAPWSALAHLSATLSGFEAALDLADANASTPPSVSHDNSEPPSTGRLETQSTWPQPPVPAVAADFPEPLPQPEFSTSGWDAVAALVTDVHPSEKEVEEVADLT